MPSVIPYCTGMVTTKPQAPYLYIAERMAAAKLKDGAVAKLCRVERVTVLRWKRPEEQHRINNGKMALLAAALQCEVVDLFLPPGQVNVAIETAGRLAKRG